ncbi:hypothetical protein JX266_009887 [Neoarthrinium moseri]|nr:hypothetical protein JX266_009887 [Neoarthrinium moseri]
MPAQQHTRSCDGGGSRANSQRNNRVPLGTVDWWCDESLAWLLQLPHPPLPLVHLRFSDFDMGDADAKLYLSNSSISHGGGDRATATGSSSVHTGHSRSCFFQPDSLDGANVAGGFGCDDSAIELDLVMDLTRWRR